MAYSSLWQYRRYERKSNMKFPYTRYTYTHTHTTVHKSISSSKQIVLDGKCLKGTPFTIYLSLSYCGFLSTYSILHTRSHLIDYFNRKKQHPKIDIHRKKNFHSSKGDGIIDSGFFLPVLNGISEIEK